MASALNPSNVVWSVGYLFGTIGATPGATAGVTLVDDVPFGILQDFTLKDALTIKELMGPASLLALGIGFSERKLSGDAKFAVIRARQFKMFRGATVTFSTLTTVASGILDEPTMFDLHLKSPSDGSQAELKLYNCVCPEIDVNFKLRDFVIPNATFQAYGDLASGKAYDLLLPGDQTTS